MPALQGFLLSIVLLAAGAWPARAQAPPPARDAAHLAQATLGHLPGAVAVGVLRDGRIEVAVRRRERMGQPLEVVDVQGRPDAEPVFEIGSVSKVFNGLLVAQRVERGDLQLDTTLAQLLQPHVTFRYELVSAITVRQLLTHTSCLPRWPADFSESNMYDRLAAYDRARLWATLGQWVLGRSPPCETRYSNIGHAALGEALAARERRSWEALVLEGIAQPLRLRDTRVQVTPAMQARIAPPWNGARRGQASQLNAFAAAGGLRSTASDLLRLSQAVLQTRDGPLGPAAGRLVTDLAAFGEQGGRIAYGVLMPPAPARVWMHNGEVRSYLAEWIIWPDTREAVVILVSNKAAPARQVARALIDQTGAAPVQEAVYTRGELRSVAEEDGGRRLYVRVKLVTGQQIPFSTLTYRVTDRRLVQGMEPGTPVEFRAERIDGENTITALRRMAP